MVDLFTLALTHGLMLLALWRLLFRTDLDSEGEPNGRKLRAAAPAAEAESGDA